MKESFFQIALNQAKSEWAFFDLTAASGQMGFEAYSLGFSPVIMSDIDRRKIKHITKQSVEHSLGVEVYLRDCRKMVSHIFNHSQAVIYIDLPYSFWQKDKVNVLDSFLFRFFMHYVTLKNAHSFLFCIQGPRDYHFAAALEPYLKNCRIEHRKHRSHQLTLLYLDAKVQSI